MRPLRKGFDRNWISIGITVVAEHRDQNGAILCHRCNIIDSDGCLILIPTTCDEFHCGTQIQHPPANAIQMLGPGCIENRVFDLQVAKLRTLRPQQCGSSRHDWGRHGRPTLVPVTTSGNRTPDG